MDYLHTAMGIGLSALTSCVHNVGSEQLSREARNFIPQATDEETTARIDFIADSLIDMKISQLLLLSPELRLMEALVARKYTGKVFVYLASGLNAQEKEKVSRNVPPNLDVGFVEVGKVPPRIVPATSAVIAFGFGGAHTAYLPGYQQWQLLYCREFCGQVILACIASADQGERPLGWYACATSETFTTVIC